MHAKDEELCRVVVARVRLRTTQELEPTSCLASLTPVVARFIEHLTTILSDKSGDYSATTCSRSIHRASYGHPFR